MRLMAFDKTGMSNPVDNLWFDGQVIDKKGLDGLPIRVTVAPSGDDLIISAEWPNGVDEACMLDIARSYAMEAEVFSATADLDDDDGFIER